MDLQHGSHGRCEEEEEEVSFREGFFLSLCSQQVKMIDSDLYHFRRGSKKNFWFFQCRRELKPFCQYFFSIYFNKMAPFQTYFKWIVCIKFMKIIIINYEQNHVNVATNDTFSTLAWKKISTNLTIKRWFNLFTRIY